MVECNNTAKVYPDTSTLQELFEAQVAHQPEAVAVVYGDTTLTYRTLNTQANRLAHQLIEIGVGRETLVGLCVHRSLDLLIGLLGTVKAGGTYVALDPLLPKARLAFMLEDAAVPVLLTQREILEQLPTTTARVLCLDDKSGVYRDDNPGCSLTPDDLAYVNYTSGSTGKPKGVQISHRALVNFLTSMRDEPGMSQDDVLLAVTTISFDIAALEIYLPLVVGGTVVLASRDVAMSGVALIESLKSCRATVMQATPATWRMLIAAGWEGDPNLKVLCGGEALARDLVGQLSVCCGSLWNMYGPTETTIWSGIRLVDRPWDGTAASEPIGRPIGNTQFYVLDRHLQPVPLGVTGELHIGGVGLAQGYLKRPAPTCEKFIPDPFSSEPGVRLYKTGDLVRALPDGVIEFLGRTDHQIKLRGFRIETWGNRIRARRLYTGAAVCCCGPRGPSRRSASGGLRGAR